MVESGPNRFTASFQNGFGAIAWLSQGDFNRRTMSAYYGTLDQLEELQALLVAPPPVLLSSPVNVTIPELTDQAIATGVTAQVTLGTQTLTAPLTADPFTGQFLDLPNGDGPYDLVAIITDPNGIPLVGGAAMDLTLTHPDMTVSLNPSLRSLTQRGAQLLGPPPPGQLTWREILTTAHSRGLLSENPIGLYWTIPNFTLNVYYSVQGSHEVNQSSTDKTVRVVTRDVDGANPQNLILSLPPGIQGVLHGGTPGSPTHLVMQGDPAFNDSYSFDISSGAGSFTMYVSAQYPGSATAVDVAFPDWASMSSLWDDQTFPLPGQMAGDCTFGGRGSIAGFPQPDTHGFVERHGVGMTNLDSRQLTLCGIP
jgi:hypothetical protein